MTNACASSPCKVAIVVIVKDSRFVELQAIPSPISFSRLASHNPVPHVSVVTDLRLSNNERKFQHLTKYDTGCRR